MSATPQDVQAKLDAATKALSHTTNPYPLMVQNYGTDWKKWPTGSFWYTALSGFAAARTEVGQLDLQAAFVVKEV